jgi:uncharacterized protein (UPF0335 family)
MRKKVIITVKLVAEASKESNNKIEREILKDSKIPWCREIEKVTIEEVENPYKELRGHGLSKKVARNVVRFYRG